MTTIAWSLGRLAFVPAALALAFTACRGDASRAGSPRAPVGGAATARPAQRPLVTNLRSFTGRPYGVVPRGFRLRSGPYADRSFYVIAAPSELLGADLVRTADADKNSQDDPLMTFELTAPAQVYIAWSAGTFYPDWLSAWTPVRPAPSPGLQVVYEPVKVDVFEAQLFSRRFPAGPVSLGPVRERSGFPPGVEPERFQPDDAVWMYFVLAVPAPE